MAWILYLFFSAGYLLPHGDLHEQIVALSNSIAQFPDSTRLYLERGELYLLHEDPKGAYSDFSTCLHSGLVNSRVYLGLGKSLLLLNRPDSALFFTDLALDQDRNHFPSLECRAIILVRLSRHCDAAAAYTRLISMASEPSPSLYLDASYAWIHCPEPEASGKASEVLIHGMKRLGQLHVLEKELVGVYLYQKRYEDALRVQHEIIRHWDSKARPYYDLAQIHLLMGDNEAATNDLHHALDSLDELPPYKASTPAMTALRTKITDLLKQLEG